MALLALYLVKLVRLYRCNNASSRQLEVKYRRIRQILLQNRQVSLVGASKAVVAVFYL